jgi:hypothetical protein
MGTGWSHPYLVLSTALFFLTGIASMMVSFFLSIYYNVINAWGFWYLFHSFQVSHSPRVETKRKEDVGPPTWGSRCEDDSLRGSQHAAGGDGGS